MASEEKKPQTTTDSDVEDYDENIIEIPGYTPKQVQIITPETSKDEDLNEEKVISKPAWKVIRDRVLGRPTARKNFDKSKEQRERSDQVESTQKTTSGRLAPSPQSSPNQSVHSTTSFRSSRFHSTHSTETSSSRLTLNKARVYSTHELSEMVEETIEIDDEDEVNFQQKTTQRQMYIVFAVFVAALSIGITLGYSSVLIQKIKYEQMEFEVNTKTQSWLGSSCTITMAPGAIVTGIVADKVGRKTLCLLAAIPFIVSFILIPSTNIFGLMILGRCLGGLAIGILFAISPTYIGEVSHPKLRGLFMRCVSSAVSVGILCIHFLAEHTNWRMVSYVSAFAPLTHFLLFLYCPESPMWLIKQKKINKGRETFYWLRGQTVKSEIEFNNFMKEISSMKFNQTTVFNDLKVILLPEVWKPTVTVMFCFLVVQSSGYIVLVFYPLTIIRNVIGKDFPAGSLIFVIDMTRLGMSAVGYLAFDLFDRKLLLAIGGVTTSFTLMGLSFHICHIEDSFKSRYYMIPLVLLSLSVASVSTFLVSLPWVLCGELIPLKARDLCVGVCSAFGFLCLFIVTHSYLFVIENFRDCAMVMACGVCVCIGSIILFFIIPETRGKTHSQIEEFYVRNER